MRLKTALFIFVVTACICRPADAYLQGVHRKITETAFDRLQIDFRSRLGITPDQHVAGAKPRVLIGDGAFDEDNNVRCVNHFYDPAHEAPLTVGALFCLPVPGSFTARDWTLNRFTWNSYNLSAAHQHYFLALTSKQKDAREQETAHLFTTLGHMVHLVQDMAQPEHTRNDQHLPHTEILLGNGTKASLYEEWGDPNIASEDPAVLPLVDYGGYPDVSLPAYASYFHTPEQSPAGGSLGRGLADFSNRSFVTQDTNYGDYLDPLKLHCFTYAEPSEKDTVARIQTVTERVLLGDGTCCKSEDVEEGIYTSFPVDYYTGATETDPFHSFVSSLDLETRQYNPESRFYSLGDASYLSRAQMLVPRAVGYSAGFVEHFFRGSLVTLWTRNNDYTYDLTLYNRSAERIGADASVTAIYAPGKNYFVPPTDDDAETIIDEKVSNLVPAFTGIAPGQSVTIPSLRVPSLPPEDVIDQFERRVAVTGTLGSESDEVIGDVQPPWDDRGLHIVIRGNNPRTFVTIVAEKYANLPPQQYDWYQYQLMPGCWILGNLSCHHSVLDQNADFLRGYAPDRADIRWLNPDPSGYELRAYLGSAFRTSDNSTLSAQFYMNGKLVREEKLDSIPISRVPFHWIDFKLPQ